MGWRILDHRADGGFEAEGDTLDEVFLHGAEAFLFLATGLTFKDFAPKTAGEETLELSALDLEELAVSWISELLFLAEAQGRLFRPKLIKISAYPPRLWATGETMAFSMGAIPIKAATYGGLILRTEPRPFLRMFLDL